MQERNNDREEMNKAVIFSSTEVNFYLGNSEEAISSTKKNEFKPNGSKPRMLTTN